MALVKFGELMARPWVAAIAVEYVVFRRFFAAVLSITIPDGDITKCYRHDPPPDYILTSRYVPQHVAGRIARSLSLRSRRFKWRRRGLAISHDEKV